MSRHKSQVPSGEPSWGDFLGMGVAAAAILAVGICAGLLVDHWLGTVPVLTLVGLLLGIAGTCVYCYAQMTRALKGPKAR